MHQRLAMIIELSCGQNFDDLTQATLYWTNILLTRCYEKTFDENNFDGHEHTWAYSWWLEHIYDKLAWVGYEQVVDDWKLSISWWWTYLGDDSQQLIELG